MNILYIPNVETLKERQLSSSQCASVLPEAILLSDFLNPAEMKSLCAASPNSRFYGLPSLFAMRFYDRRWVKPRPIFSFAMIGAVVAITGFRDPAVVVRSRISHSSFLWCTVNILCFLFIEQNRIIGKLDGRQYAKKTRPKCDTLGRFSLCW